MTHIFAFREVTSEMERFSEIQGRDGCLSNVHLLSWWKEYQLERCNRELPSAPCTSFSPLPVAVTRGRCLTSLLFIQRVWAVPASIGWQLNDDPMSRLLSGSRVPWKEAMLQPLHTAHNRISQQQLVLKKFSSL